MEQVAKFYEETVAFLGNIAPDPKKKRGIGSVFGVSAQKQHSGSRRNL